MDILSISPPRLNPNDVSGSFQKISDYLQNMTELIDFTLGQYSGQLSIVDPSGIQSLLNNFRAEIVKIQREVSGIKTMVSSIESEVESNKSSISSLEQRVSELEGGA